MGGKGKWSALRSLKGKKMWLLVGGVVLGGLLLLLGGRAEAAGEKTATEQSEATVAAAALSDYRTAMEAQVKALCASVSGVSSVEVMVTFECGYRVIFATDGSGNPATVGNGSSESALYESILPPVVAGVGIVCHGGDAPVVQQKLTELVSTTLGVSSNRVFVTGK